MSRRLEQPDKQVSVRCLIGPSLKYTCHYLSSTLLTIQAAVKRRGLLYISLGPKPLELIHELSGRVLRTAKNYTVPNE